MHTVLKGDGATGAAQEPKAIMVRSGPLRRSHRELGLLLWEVAHTLSLPFSNSVLNSLDIVSPKDAPKRDVA